MDWKQKYTEAKYKYELDEWFLKQLREFTGNIPDLIASKIDNMPEVETTYGEVEFIAGTVTDNNLNPVFFLFEYFKRSEDNHIALIDIYDIELNDYLDFININKYIK